MQISKLGVAPFKFVRSIGSVALVAALAGCTGLTPVYRDIAPITGPTPYINRTPMHAALMCVRKRVAAAPDIRFGVADFVDGTGATMGDTDVNGRYFSQRPDLMLVVALSKAGVHLVNRSSTGVAEWEMKQAMDKRLGDGKPTVVGNTRFDYRPVRAGEFLGSNYYIHGAITEINWNLSSDANEVGAFGLTAGRRTYRVSMAVDLVVSNSTTTEVVFARSYSKQLVGYETGAGVFRFVNAAVVPGSAVELFQANIGQKQNEPVQQALRWLVETAGYDIVSQIYGRDPGCDALVPGAEPSDDRDPAMDLPAVQPPMPAQQSAPVAASKPASVTSPAATTVNATSRAPKTLEQEPLAPPRSVEWTRPQYGVGAAIQPEPGRPEDARAVQLRRDPAVRAAQRPPLPMASQNPATTPVRDVTPRTPIVPADDAPVMAPQTSLERGTMRDRDERLDERQVTNVQPAPISGLSASAAEMSVASAPVDAISQPAPLPPQAVADRPVVHVGNIVAANFSTGAVGADACTGGWNRLFTALSFTAKSDGCQAPGLRRLRPMQGGTLG